MSSYGMGHAMGVVGGSDVPLGAYGAEVMADGPVMYLRYNDGPRYDDLATPGQVASQVVKDYTRRHTGEVNTSNGTYTSGVMLGQPGATAPGWAAAGGMYSAFSPSNDWWIGSTGELTVELFVKQSPIAGASVVELAASPGWALRMSHTGLFSQAGSDAANATIALDDSAWHHLVLSIASGVSIGLYADGVPVATTTVGTLAPIPDLQYLAVGFTLQGGIDEFAIYPSALSAARVAAHYAAA